MHCHELSFGRLHVTAYLRLGQTTGLHTRRKGTAVKAKLAVAAVVTLCCLATFAASARADTSGAESTPSVACHWTVGPGLFTLSCTTADGAVYQCSLTF